MRAAGVPQRTPPTVPAARVAFIVLPYTVSVLGISGPEFLVIVLVAVIVVGPQRLPEYARKLTQAVRRLRVFLDDAKEQIAEEVGPELADLNLSDLNPRNYDPRKIVRDALGEDLDAIRRDLASPFQSAARTARETADDIVRTGSTKSLAQMVDDKAEQTRRARGEGAAQADSGEPAGSGDDGATSGTGDGRDDVERGAVEVEEPVRAEGTEGTEDVAEAEGTEDAVEAEGPVRAEDAEGAVEAEEPAEAPEPSAEDGAREAAADAADEGSGAPSSGDDEPAGAPEEPGPAAGAPPGAAESPEPDALEPVPSSLVEGGASETAPRIRPVSPREIVRAANAAARTRAEAASAVVDV